jgi:glutamate transport system permease protein
VGALAGYTGDFVHGFLVTVQIGFVGFLVAVVVGLLIALCRVCPLVPLRNVGTTYVEVFRNTPLLVLLFLIFFGLPYVGIKFGLVASAIVGLGFYEAAFVCEVIRSGINTVPVGQAEAARAIGLNAGRVLGSIVLPQALRAVVQPMGNLFITTILNSSLAAAIGCTDITGTANHVFAEVVRPIPIYVGAGIAYFALTITIGLLTGVVERRTVIVR